MIKEEKTIFSSRFLLLIFTIVLLFLVLVKKGVLADGVLEAGELNEKFCKALGLLKTDLNKDSLILI